MRCPHCGNDVVSTQYTCHVCSSVLIVETLERHVGFLARYEERWRKPMKFWERVKWLIIRPSRAFWDIVHKPNDDGGAFAFFTNIFLFGLVGVILFNKAGGAGLYSGSIPNSGFLLFMHGLAMYLMFVVIGLIYFVILWGFITVAHTIAAKYALNITIRWPDQQRVMYWAFVPAILCTGVYVAVLAIGLPQLPQLAPVPLPGSLDPNILIAAASQLFVSPAWIVADVVQILFYFGYLTIVLAIAFREYYDKSTTRELITAVTTGVICAVVFVLTRSSFL